jgi:hypothetical protein
VTPCALMAWENGPMGAGLCLVKTACFMSAFELWDGLKIAKNKETAGLPCGFKSLPVL